MRWPSVSHPTAGAASATASASRRIFDTVILASWSLRGHDTRCPHNGWRRFMIRGFSGETAPENVNPILIGATAYSFVASGAASAWGLLLAPALGDPETGEYRNLYEIQDESEGSRRRK